MSEELARWLDAQLDEDENEARRLYPSDAASRLLREVEAKRQLLDEHPSINVSDLGSDCGTCYRDDGINAHWPCRTLRLLALPYADRPGYRDAWRP